MLPSGPRAFGFFIRAPRRKIREERSADEIMAVEDINSLLTTFGSYPGLSSLVNFSIFAGA
jgi:hypothetical protein